MRAAAKIWIAAGMGVGIGAALGAASPRAVWASPEFAYSSEKWETLRDNILEYSELSDLIHEYNVTVINNRIAYDEYRGKSNDDLKNAYADLADQLFDASDKMMDSIDEDQEGYGSAAASAALTRVQAEQNQRMADEENGDGYVKQLEYAREEALLVKEAQSLMISYWKKEKERPLLEQERILSENGYETAVVKAANGMITQAELLDAEEKKEGANAALLTNETERDALRRELCVMTGWSYDGKPEIREVPVPALEEADLIDLAQDKTRALEKNFTQAVNQRRLEHSLSDDQQDVLERRVEDGKRQIEADLEGKYALLIQARADYIRLTGESELAALNAQSAQRRYDLGMITRNQYLELQSQAVSSLSAKETAGLSYRQAMEDYCWAVEGLARAEG